MSPKDSVLLSVPFKFLYNCVLDTFLNSSLSSIFLTWSIWFYISSIILFINIFAGILDSIPFNSLNLRLYFSISLLVPNLIVILFILEIYLQKIQPIDQANNFYKNYISFYL